MASFRDGNRMSVDHIQFKRATKAQLETSDYVPLMGEIVLSANEALLKVGDGTRTLAQLDFVGAAGMVEDSYDSTATDKGLSAAKGKDLNDRIEKFRNITIIDCGELPVEETEEPEEQSGEQFKFNQVIGEAFLPIYFQEVKMAINNGVLTLKLFQIRHATSSELASSSYVPAEGELIGEVDTGKLKLGNGVKRYSELPYVGA